MRFYTSAQLVKSNVLLRGYEDGKRIQVRVPVSPYLFVPSKSGQSKYRTLQGKPVDKLSFDTVSEARDFMKRYEDVEGFEYYGLDKFLYTFLYDAYPGEIQYDPDLIRVMFLDIETKSDDGFPDIKAADKEVTAITVKIGRDVVSFGFLEDFDPLKKYRDHKYNFTYVRCRDELDMLGKFLLFWENEKFNPDVVTGWNIEFFDIPYLVNRITRVMSEADAKRLSPWKMLNEKTIEIRGREQQTFFPMGVAVLDYLPLYKKFSFKNHESYKLDHIAEAELEEKKLDYSEYESMHEFYISNFQKFMEYNVHDVLLVDKLEDKLGLIAQVYALAYDAKVNYGDTLATVTPWDVIIHNYLLDRGIVVPQYSVSNEMIEIPGGYVKEPQIGMPEWVVSFDLNSLYPHLIMQYNISPEMYRGKLQANLSVDDLLAGKLKDHKFAEHLCVAGNMALYDRTQQGFLAEIMQKMYDDRVVYKKKMIEAKKRFEQTKSKEDAKAIARYHNLQLAKKIQLNSAYGALGNRYFRWFNITHATAITLSGQLSIRWIEMKMNQKLNQILKTKNVDYVIASDTDSIYITLNKLVQMVMPEEKDKTKIVNFIDKVCKEVLEPFIDNSYQELADYMNAYQQKMKMKRESIADKGVWKAKKMYILNVWDSEDVRYAEPQLKMMGIEAVRSSTPAAIRKQIKKTLELVMNTDEPTVQHHIGKFKEEFMKLDFDQIAFPRGCNGMWKYADRSSIYKKGTPIAVRGALLFNHMIKEKGLEKKLEQIYEGDKVKFCYLKTPNPIRENVISVSGSLPKEFGLEKYLDYETQFNKGYLDPIKSILDAIGWQPVKKASLMSFFG